jgi:hypothetical protein
VERALKEEDPFISVTSTVFTSVESVENMDESKVYSDSCRGLNTNGNSVSLTGPGHYKLRSCNFEKQKTLTSHDIDLTQNGLLGDSNFEEDETVNSLNNVMKSPLTSCLNGHKDPDLGKHLSKHAKSAKRRVHESNFGQLSEASDIPEILKLDGSKEETKVCGQFQKSHLNVNYLEDANKVNCSVSHNKSTIKPNSDIQLISNVDVHYKEKAQNNSHNRKSQRNAPRRESLYNNSLHPNNTCMQSCYVKLVRLEDTTQQTRISPCKIKSRLRNHKDSTVQSHGSKSNVRNCSSCKSCENSNKISQSHYRCVVDNKECKMLCSSSRQAKAMPCETNTQQTNKHFFSSGDGTRNNRVVTRSSMKCTCISVPASHNMLNGVLCRCAQIKTSENSGSNILYMNMMAEQSPSNVACNSIEGFVDCERIDAYPVSVQIPTEAKNKFQFDKLTDHSRGITALKTRRKTYSEIAETGTQESEIGQSLAEARNKILCVKEQGDTDSVQIERWKHMRRKTGKGKEYMNKKLLNNLIPDKCNLLSKMKPLSISLERLDQSVVEKYSVILSSVTSRTLPQNNTDSIQQEVASTCNTVKSCPDVRWKRRARSRKPKHVYCHDRIPCLDGVFETSSSDDCTQYSTDCYKQLEKSPVTKKARRQEKVIQKAENKLTDLQHKNADDSDSSALRGTPLQEPRFETPTENLKNTVSSCQTCSPVRSPRKSLYPPLNIKIQKSPKKRNVDTEDRVQGKPSDMSEVIENISVPSNTEESNRLSGEDIEVTRPKHVAVEQKLKVQIQEQPKDICSIFEKRKAGSSSVSVEPSQIFHTSHPTAVEVSVTASSICHDEGTTEDQQNMSAEKCMYVMSTFTTTCSFNLGY